MDTKHEATKQKACGIDDSSQFDDLNEIEYPTREGHSNEQLLRSKRLNTVDDLKKGLHEKFVLVLQAKEIEYEQKLDAQKSIDAATNACIQDELETERAEHAATKEKLDALQERTDDHKSANDKVLMVKEFDLKTVEAEHAATKLKLDAAQTELCKFKGIDSTKALADHITWMQVYIDKLRQRLERMYGSLDERLELQIKDMEDTLLLKTPTNYKFLFMSEMACRMGFTFTTKELKAIGYQIAIEYKGTKGELPSKHIQMVEGL